MPPSTILPEHHRAVYIESGQRHVELLRRFGLRPDHDVLDIGCGAGRLTAALSGFLTGGYEGFDVSPERIAWCQENLPGNFQVLDVFNRTYNHHRGRWMPPRLSFPTRTSP